MCIIMHFCCEFLRFHLLLLLLCVIGFLLIGFFGNWFIATGMLIMLWANNMMIFEEIFRRINRILHIGNNDINPTNFGIGEKKWDRKD